MKTVHEVFTPNDVPTVTYVDRSHLNLEDHLRDTLAMKNTIVSLSGPSKSGKTVLVQKVIDPNLLIPVSGAAIKSSDDLWSQALQWMGTPQTVSTSTTTGGSVDISATGGGEAGIPLVAKGKVEGSFGGSALHQRTVVESARSTAFQQVVHEIGSSEFIIFVDDFHYIDRDTQVVLGKQMKAIAEKGVKICAASVPHRADDVVRSNPELSGRVAAVKLDYWERDELKKIAQQGFPELGVELSEVAIDRLTREAFGIPQLMQSLCLNLCLELGIRSERSRSEYVDVPLEVFSHTFERTSDLANYSSVIQGLHSGPKERGTERKQFKLKDGSVGDVYRCLLMALREDPPKLSFTYDDIMDRVKAVCVEESPVGSSITQALAQMEKLTTSLSPSVPIIEWNESVLDVVEPYFLFFLRGSRKLERLA